MYILLYPDRYNQNLHVQHKLKSMPVQHAAKCSNEYPQSRPKLRFHDSTTEAFIIRHVSNGGVERDWSTHRLAETVVYKHAVSALDLHAACSVHGEARYTVTANGNSPVASCIDHLLLQT